MSITVNDYADKVIEILETNDISTQFDEIEIEWIVDCHFRNFPPSLCAFGIGDCREVYERVLKQERMWDRVDEMLRRAA